MRRILIVEDDQDLAFMLQLLLERYGARVWIAHSLAEVEAQRPDALACDLALLDVQLGRGVPTGLDVQRWLRAQGWNGETVFLTGHAAAHPELAAGGDGARTRVLAKPASLADLAGLAQAP